MKDIPVIYKDTDILLVNKPAGIPVQGGEGIKISLTDILERQAGTKIYPVHRLDRDTAGILVLALNRDAAGRYSQYITDGSIKKEYAAVCFYNDSIEKKGTITLPAGRSGSEKPSRTFYHIDAAGSEAALFYLQLGTGRMHQIRIHLASIGCPIIADDKYGDFRKNREFRSSHNIRKLQLAACTLTLPVNNTLRRFTVPLPEHMQHCLDSLGIQMS
ncbi:RluA family pseudouridine synthase [Brucepastera parasyntrophica]|uniref:RluA family pseudouridine synthase n=1 Tax=Brucepastera parasyntrophica TaxID=2880008 RepID=UPI00210CD048|nr:RluA family pseudouridine synthase [Brucepastera parasyntrophica]ULQ59675.1 RluA family pseudouridine synthase [Brucepastera parasyntrophica]